MQPAFVLLVSPDGQQFSWKMLPGSARMPGFTFAAAVKQLELILAMHPAIALPEERPLVQEHTEGELRLGPKRGES